MELRIKEIRVLGLFGMFDHVIPLNLDSHITIIYGENGIGKTMIFRILNALFEMDFQILGSLPFSLLELDFENGNSLKIKRGKLLQFASPSFEKEVTIDVVSNKDASLAAILEEITSSQIGSLDEEIVRQRLLSALSKVRLGRSNSKFERMRFDLRNGFPLSAFGERYEKELKELISKNIDYWSEFIGSPKPKCPDNLAKILGALNCNLIGTSRLFITSKGPEEQFLELPPRYHSSVSFYSDEMAREISDQHAEYQKESDRLELSLRKRLSSGELSQSFSSEQLRTLVDDVSSRRRELREVGLWDESELDSMGPIEELNDVSRAILGVNLLDTKTKLAVFDAMYEQMRLFRDIINERRFSYKKLSIHPKQGFVFTNANGEELSLTDLSSGEQHELILLYQLLFKVPKNALILIDEPEISLHVEWQKAFIQDMSEIIRLRGFDIMLATHSPSIINGHWDYTVSLKGKELVHG